MNDEVWSNPGLPAPIRLPVTWVSRPFEPPEDGFHPGPLLISAFHGLAERLGDAVVRDGRRVKWETLQIWSDPNWREGLLLLRASVEVEP